MSTDRTGGEPHHDELAAAVRNQLDAVLGERRLYTGTLVAHGLSDIFSAEVRQQGWDPAWDAWRALDDLAILALGDQLGELLTRHGEVRCKLPAGTGAMGFLLGSAYVGTEVLVLDVDRPGLHALFDIPKRPGGANLAFLLETIDALSRDRPCRGVGMPTLVERFDEHPLHLLQFPPFAHACDVVLQRSLIDATAAFCSLSTRKVLDLAEDIVVDMRDLWNNGRAIAPRVVMARDAARHLVAHFPDVRVHAVTVELHHQRFQERLAVGVEFETLDHALRRGIAVQHVDADDEPGNVLSAAAVDRSVRAAAVHALGADGWIEGVARAVVDAAPQGPAAVLADLGDRLEVSVVLPTGTGPLRIRLRWWHGAVRAATEDSHDLSILHSMLWLRTSGLPHTLIGGLAGRPLHAALDGPFRCASPIASAVFADGLLTLDVRPDLWLVDCAAGRMWPDPTVGAGA